MQEKTGIVLKIVQMDGFPGGNSAGLWKMERDCGETTDIFLTDKKDKGRMGVGRGFGRCLKMGGDR